MIKYKYIVGLILSMWSFVTATFADSPLTSTPFYEAYIHEEMVSMASKQDHTLTPALMDYLNDEEVPIVHRLAAINALLWTIDRTDNFEKYLVYLVEKEQAIHRDDFLETCTATQLICLAYLKALDNHFDVAEALHIADRAIEKDQERIYSIYLIHGLIKAQHVMDESWCKTYQATQKVRSNKSLKIDMNTEAIKIIFDYMDLYQGDCPQKSTKN